MNIKRLITLLVAFGLALVLLGCAPPPVPSPVAISATSIAAPTTSVVSTEVINLAPDIPVNCADCSNRALIVKTYAVNWGYPAGSTLRVSYMDYIFITEHGGCEVIQDYA